MLKVKKKILAQKLRKKGYSISEIAYELGMEKSGSISNWCRDICFSQKQIDRLVDRQRSGSYKGRIVFLEKLRKNRIESKKKLKEEGIKEIGELRNKDFFTAGVAMYWSEGYKYSGGEQVGFTNSDSSMILFMLKWFNDICNISKDRIRLQVKINKEHENRIEDIERYWSEITNISREQFNKTVLIKAKTKKIYPNPNDYFGTLRITVRNGTQLRRKINGWIEGLKLNI